MATHALVTGTGITGRIPVPYDAHPDDFVDVTPDVLYFEHDSRETPPALLAVADAIEDEHYVRGTHPIQLACKALDDPEEYPVVTDDLREQHRALHDEVHGRVTGRAGKDLARNGGRS